MWELIIGEASYFGRKKGQKRGKGRNFLEFREKEDFFREQIRRDPFIFGGKKGTKKGEKGNDFWRKPWYI